MQNEGRADALVPLRSVIFLRICFMVPNLLFSPKSEIRNPNLLHCFEFALLFDKGMCEALYNADRRSHNYSLFNIQYSLKKSYFAAGR